jgi:5-formyltetrahydrofolate cyclo-ligase
MRKEELRKKYLGKRSQIDTDKVNEYNQAICDLFFEKFNLGEIKVLHIFLPIQGKREIDTWRIIRKIWEAYPSVEITVPKVDFLNNKMHCCLLKPASKVVNNPWNIPEPEPAAFIGNEKIDMILVPLLSFDVFGNRVGYGNGFYDRFLKSCPQKLVKIGLSYFEAEEKIEDIIGQDVPLDFCVTPKNLYAF